MGEVSRSDAQTLLMFEQREGGCDDDPDFEGIVEFYLMKDGHGGWYVISDLELDDLKNKALMADFRREANELARICRAPVCMAFSQLNRHPTTIIGKVCSKD